MNPPLPLDEALHRRAVAMATALGTTSSPFADDEVDGAGFACLEHLLHELAHARLLRVPLAAGLSDGIARALSRCTPEHRAHQEAWTWVIEYEGLKMLGLEQRLPWEDCVGEACVQEGVTVGLMLDARRLWTSELRKHAEVIYSVLKGPGHGEVKEKDR